MFLLNTLSLIWLLLTFFTGFLTTHGLLPIPPLLHPIWALGSSVPAMALLFINGKKNPSQSFFLPVMGIAVAVLTGIGFAMGFLPFFWHRVIVWVLGVLLGLGLLKNLLSSRAKSQALKNHTGEP